MLNYIIGPRHWIKRTFNIQIGCSHRCKFCHVCATYRLWWGLNPLEWPIEKIYERTLNRRLPDRRDPVIYPSCHDITPEHLHHHITFIQRLVKKYPQVIIATKPHLVCVDAICRALKDYRGRITFRFAIGSANNEVLDYWEPGAPGFEERMACLKLARSCGFGTSVAIEPMLDGETEELVGLVRPFVTDSIWIGKPKMLKQRLAINCHRDPETMARATQLLGVLSDEYVKALYDRFKDDPLIRWKKTIRAVIDPCGWQFYKTYKRWMG